MIPTDPAPGSLPPGYFDDVYRANPDPWAFATSPYEAAKYDATLAALPNARYTQRVRGRLLHRRAHRTPRPALRSPS